MVDTIRYTPKAEVDTRIYTPDARVLADEQIVSSELGSYRIRAGNNYYDDVEVSMTVDYKDKMKNVYSASDLDVHNKSVAGQTYVHSKRIRQFTGEFLGKYVAEGEMIVKIEYSAEKPSVGESVEKPSVGGDDDQLPSGLVFDVTSAIVTVSNADQSTQDLTFTYDPQAQSWKKQTV